MFMIMLLSAINKKMNKNKIDPCSYKHANSCILVLILRRTGDIGFKGFLNLLDKSESFQIVYNLTFVPKHKVGTIYTQVTLS